MIARIIINKHVIKQNKLRDVPEPPISVQTSKGVHRAHTVELNGPARLVYRPDKPLKCGATVWIETQLEHLTLS